MSLLKLHAGVLTHKPETLYINRFYGEDSKGEFHWYNEPEGVIAYDLVEGEWSADYKELTKLLEGMGYTKFDTPSDTIDTFKKGGGN